MSAIFQRIDEITVFVDTDKVEKEAKLSYGGDVDAMLVQKYGIKKNHYDVEGKDKWSIAGSVMSGKNTKINRFLDDYNCRFLKDTSMSKLTPDSDGYTFKGLSGSTTSSVPVAGNSNTTGKVSTPNPNSGSSSGAKKVVPIKTTNNPVTLPNDVIVKVSGSEIKMKFVESVVKDYKVVLYRDGDELDFSKNLLVPMSVKESEYETHLLKMIDSQFSSVFGIFNNFILGVKGKSVSISYDSGSVAYKSKIRFIGKAEKGVLDYSVKIDIDNFKTYKQEIITFLMSRIKDDSVGQAISDKKAVMIKKKGTDVRKLYRIMGDYVLSKYVDYGVSSNLEGEIILNLDSSGKGISSFDFTLTDMVDDSDLDLTTLISMLKGTIKGKGVDDMGYNYCKVNVSDPIIINDIIYKYSLNEMFGFSYSTLINEGDDGNEELGLDSEEEELLKDIFKDILTKCSDYEFEYNSNKNSYECFFTFNKDVDVESLGDEITVEEIDGELYGYVVVELED